MHYIESEIKMLFSLLPCTLSTTAGFHISSNTLMIVPSWFAPGNSKKYSNAGEGKEGRELEKSVTGSQIQRYVVWRVGDWRVVGPGRVPVW